MRRWRMLRVLALWLTAALFAPAAAGFAQAVPTPVLRSRLSLATGSAAAPAADAPSPWWAPLASLAVPGTGQTALKQPRGIAYVAAEAFVVVQYLAAQRDGNRDRDAYRQLAADVARQAFGGQRPQGSWEYYESMEKFLESGAFNRTPGATLTPESDPTTYNGARWLLARQNYWANPNVAPEQSSPEYQRAIAFYQASAVPDAFRWSWRDSQLQQDLYRQTIRSANRSYQRATNMLGVLAANHLVSLIDAYVTVRMRRYGGVNVAGLSLDGITTGYRTDPRTGASQLSLGFRAR